MYLSPADNPAGAVWSRSRDLNRTVLPSHLGFPWPCPGRCPVRRHTWPPLPHNHPTSTSVTAPGAVATAARDTATSLGPCHHNTFLSITATIALSAEGG